MRNPLVRELTDFSVRNSEKMKVMSFFTVFISALILIGYPITTNGQGMYAKQIPIYVLAFIFIFLFSLIGEYLAVWFKKEKPVHVCRCAFNLAVIGMALFELFLFYGFGSVGLGGGERPFSVSSVVAGLLS